MYSSQFIAEFYSENIFDTFSNESEFFEEATLRRFQKSQTKWVFLFFFFETPRLRSKTNYKISFVCTCFEFRAFFDVFLITKKNEPWNDLLSDSLLGVVIVLNTSRHFWQLIIRSKQPESRGWWSGDTENSSSSIDGWPWFHAPPALHEGKKRSQISARDTQFFLRDLATFSNFIITY